MNPYSITNHIDYAEHMKAYISKTECQEQLAQLRAKLQRETSQRQALESQVRTLTESLRKLLAHCSPALVPKEQRGNSQQPTKMPMEPQCSNPLVRRVRDTLKSLEKEQCNDPGSIEDHPDYPALMARAERRAREMCSKVEAETKNKWRADIRKHPDYVYLKKYYEEKLGELQAQLSRPTRG